jgi:hypothetical protein
MCILIALTFYNISVVKVIFDSTDFILNMNLLRRETEF